MLGTLGRYWGVPASYWVPELSPVGRLAVDRAAMLETAQREVDARKG